MNPARLLRKTSALLAACLFATLAFAGAAAAAGPTDDVEALVEYGEHTVGEQLTRTTDCIDDIENRIASWLEDHTSCGPISHLAGPSGFITDVTELAEDLDSWARIPSRIVITPDVGSDEDGSRVLVSARLSYEDGSQNEIGRSGLWSTGCDDPISEVECAAVDAVSSTGAVPSDVTVTRQHKRGPEGETITVKATIKFSGSGEKHTVSVTSPAVP